MSDETEYLRRELERYQEQERLEDERRTEAERRREVERKEAYYVHQHSADNWEEALHKQATLFRHEAKDEPFDSTDPNDYFFTEGMQACERALVIWQEVEKEINPQIEELEKQIEALQESIRQKVGNQLLSEDKRSGWKALALCLMNESLYSFLDW